jgi:peroxiredoxin Q/BCP
MQTGRLRSLIILQMGLLNIGDVAPEFSVKDHTGKDVHLSDFRGKTIVLWFYPKADTPG